MLKSSIAPTPRPTVVSSAGRKITLASLACPHCAYEVRAADAELHDDGDPAEAGMSDDLLAAAIHYATCGGLPVFPCLPRGKAPAVPRSFHSATLNPATIRRFGPTPNVTSRFDRRELGFLGARSRWRRGRGNLASARDETRSHSENAYRGHV